MRKFKLADAWLQSPLMLLLFIYCIINPFTKPIAIAYLVVACWQVVSMLVHEWNRWFTGPYGVRRIYHRTAIVCIGSILLGSRIILLFIAPVMFALYNYLCFREVYVKMRRPLSILK